MCLTISDIIYYSIYLICLFFCFKARYINIPGLIFLQLILPLGFLNEMTVEVLQYLKIGDNTPHYFYIPIEYILLTRFYIRNTKNRSLQKILNWSGLLYIFICIPIGILDFNPRELPSYYVLSCVLNTVWIVLILFNLETVDSMSITSIPLFWILTGLLIMYSGASLFTSAYNYLLHKDASKADKLRTYINVSLNCLLYMSMTYGFIRSKWMTKSTYQ